jgi:hypothetical protein
MVVKVVNTSPAAPSTTLTGQWIGGAEAIDCVRASGSGPSPCPLGARCDFQLSLTEPSPYDLAGTLAVGRASGPVTGWRSLTGRMFLHGTIGFENNGPHTLDLAGWNVMAEPLRHTMAGDFLMIERFTNDFGPQVLTTTYRLVDVVR